MQFIILNVKQNKAKKVGENRIQLVEMPDI